MKNNVKDKIFFAILQNVIVDDCMDTKHILDFIERLNENNNREWFMANKSEYDAIKKETEQFVHEWTAAMTDIDPDTAVLQPKECLFRIYRDVRFSSDKRPYKDHIGIILAPHGGRKSHYGCYYLHLQPGESMFAAGMWNPEPELVKALRRDIYDNYDELEEIFSRDYVKRYFTSFDEWGLMKKVPAPYPSDFPHKDWIARKMFTISTPIPDKILFSSRFLEHLLDICRAAAPINKFLNYTLESMYC